MATAGAATEGKTYSRQDELPRLPIPDIDDTCTRFLETVRPLLDADAFVQTEQAVQRFLAPTGEGRALQQALLEYDREDGRNSYIEDFWDAAYLDPTDPVVLNVNPFFVLEDDPTPSRNNQIARATSLILSSLKFACAVRSEQLDPDVWRQKPLCMSQFRRFFGTARIPREEEDEVVTNYESQHIVVLSRGQFYTFNVLSKDGGLAVSEREIGNNLRAIMEDSAQTLAQNLSAGALGALTTETRKAWARARAQLQASRVNRDYLDMVDSALFIVCLDDFSPSDATSSAENMLHGTYEIDGGFQRGTLLNRWYDKMQLIVCENGVAGVNFEHSSVDGHTVLRFASDVFTDTIMRFAQSISGGLSTLLQTQKSTETVDTSPRKLEWELPASVRSAIHFAEVKVSDLIMQNETRVLEFTDYGKRFIVSHNMSPDAFVQIAMMVAYYRMYGSFVNVYESVQTKFYLHGRTEAARCVTPEVKAYGLAFCGKVAAEEKIAALRNAVGAHVKLLKACAKGQGVDRHLFALKCLWQKMQGAGSMGSKDEESKDSDSTTADSGASAATALPPMSPKVAAPPSLFTSPGYGMLNQTMLSTSNCGNPALRLFGFGPVIRDGFGIGYIIKDEGIQFCAASKRRQTQRLLTTLQMYLRETQTLLEACEPTPPSQAPGVGKLLVRKLSTEAAGAEGDKSPMVRSQSGGGYSFWGIEEEG